MQVQLDPTVIGTALLLWPATKSLVLLGAVITNLWSRSPDRRAATRRIIAQILGDGEDAKDDPTDP